MERNRRQSLLSWLFVGALAVLCTILGVLQYRWIGEVSRAERERMQQSLRASLSRLSQDFNSEISTSCAALLPEPGLESPAPDAEYAARYLQWKETSRHGKLISSVGLAEAVNGSLVLRVFDPERRVFQPGSWPRNWTAVRDQLSQRLSEEGRPPWGRRGPGGPFEEPSESVVVVPLFDRMEESPRRLGHWLLAEVNLEYVRTALIPELVQRHLGGASEYQVQIVMRENPAIMIYHSETQPGPLIDKSADASVNLFEIRYEMLRRGMFRGLRPPERGPEWRPKEPSSAPPPEPPRFERGRWTLHVRHHAGSLEAVVAQARLRNLVVTGCVLLLIMAAVGALVRYTRRAQRLAELQMEFVAGVSHELRTPLSVMRTAGHNLQGKVASDLSRVQRYGSLIEEECEKLAAIVDQVLRFANVKAGRVIGGKEALAIRTLIAEVLEANRRVIEQSGCKVEQEIPAEVPPVLGDPTTLRHALQNLISNAAKYGKGGNWIGISASTVLNGGEAPLVEIRIADRGPGIPAQEIGHIFDPFFRGRDAVENQIHGTGLGLSLAKRIIEAHHGTIEVESEPGKGTEFLVRIPAASAKDHEFANTAG